MLFFKQIRKIINDILNDINEIDNSGIDNKDTTVKLNNLKENSKVQKYIEMKIKRI